MAKRKAILAPAIPMVLFLLLTSCAPVAQPSSGVTSATPPAASPSAPAAATATSTAVPTPAVRVPVVPTPTPATQANQPKPGGVLDVRLYLEPPGFDLHQQQLLASRMAAVPAYDSLLEYNPLKQDQIIPDLAERWETSSDGATVTFFLRKDVKFHDGTPLTADDVVFSLQRLVNPPKGVISPNKAMLGSINTIEAVGPLTVRVKLKSADAAIFDGLALPHHVIYSKASVQTRGDMKTSVMGTGPFRFVRYEPGVIVEYEKNRDYFRTGRPYLDGLRFFIIKDPSTGFAAFRTGKVKLTSQGSGGLSVTDAQIVKTQLAGKARAVLYTSLSTFFVHFNTSRKPWDDVRLRRALYLAANRQELVDVSGEGLPVVGGFMRTGGPWAIPQDELLKMPGYRQDKTQDIAEAKRLLAEAGYKNGLEVEYVVRNIDTWVRFAQVLKEQMKKVGVSLNLKIEETAAWSDRNTHENYGVLQDGYGVAVDEPTQVMGVFLPPGISFKDPTIDELRVKQQQTLDFAPRRELVLQYQKRMEELLPVSPFWWDRYYMGVWDDVKNYPEPVGLWNSHKYTEVWLDR